VSKKKRTKGSTPAEALARTWVIKKKKEKP